MIYIDETGAISATAQPGYLPVIDGVKPQPTNCQIVVKDTLVNMGDHWVQNYRLAQAPMYTAGQWLELVGFGAAEQPTLIYVKMQLQAAGKSSPKLQATEQFMNTVLGLYAVNAVPRCDWNQPPYEFQEVVSECMTILHTN